MKPIFFVADGDGKISCAAGVEKEKVFIVTYLPRETTKKKFSL